MQTTGDEADVALAHAPGARIVRPKEKWALAYPTTADFALTLAVVTYLSFLVHLGLGLAPEPLEWIFSEAGPFESLSICFWLVASAVVLWRVRPLTTQGFVFAALFALFAAREASWHKAFTTDSMLKISYYLQAPAPLAEKVVAGIVAAIFIAMLLFAGYVVFRFLVIERQYASRAGYWLMTAGALFVLTKVADRAPAWVRHSGGMIGPDLINVMMALEEGLEALAPLIFAYSVWISQSERRYLS